MSDNIENKVVDTYEEHSQHLESRTDCSECYSEKQSKMKKALEAGLQYVGDDYYGQPEFVGKKEQWDEYSEEEEINSLYEKIVDEEEEELSGCCGAVIKDGRCFDCKENI